jgi:hypothetical protein
MGLGKRPVQHHLSGEQNKSCNEIFMVPRARPAAMPSSMASRRSRADTAGRHDARRSAAAEGGREQTRGGGQILHSEKRAA